MFKPSVRREQIAGMNIHYVNYSFDYFLDTQERLGFRSIELWCGVPHVWIDHLTFYDAERIRQRIEAHHLKLRVLTPENCLYPYQVAAAEPEHIKRSREYFKNGIRLAEALGCGMMEINSGWGYLSEPAEEAWSRSREMLSVLADFAGEHGITLVLESLRPEESHIVYRLSDMKRMLSEVNSPSLKPMADLTAIEAAGESLEDWFKAFGSGIRHMHFIDGNPEGHLIWGDGHRHLGSELSVLRRYGYTAYLGQEITDGRYYADPAAADLRNMRNFERYI